MSLAAPIRFSVVSGSLPPGLGLDSAGLLSGIPTTPGPFAFTIRATGDDSNFVQRAYTMGVGEITPDFLPDATLSDPYSQTLTANGFSSPTFSTIAGALPPPLTLHPATGVISGSAPTESGVFVFTVQATDGVLTCEKFLSINVADTADIWKSLVWTVYESGAVEFGSFSENNFSGFSAKAAPGGDTAVIVGSATMMYTGPALNSRFTLAGTCVEGPPDGFAVIIYNVRYWDGFAFVDLVNSSTPYGPVNENIPFVLPALVATQIEVTISWTSDIPFGGAGTPSCSGSGSIVTDP